MRWFALLMSLLVAGPALARDGGGTDAPYWDPDAGIYEVSSAVTAIDGGELGAGWWLSRDRMKKTGDHVVEANNAKAQAERERDEALTSAAEGGGVKWFLYGLAAGVVAGGALLILGLNAVSR